VAGQRTQARERAASAAQYVLLGGFAAVAAGISAQALTGFARSNMELTGPWPYLPPRPRPSRRSDPDLALTTFIKSRPPGQLRRQQARAHRLARRVPASQVAHRRQCRDHTRHADPLPHNRKSKDQQTTSPLNGQSSREDPSTTQ
jgi:hypothetical protein